MMIELKKNKICDELLYTCGYSAVWTWRSGFIHPLNIIKKINK